MGNMPERRPHHGQSRNIAASLTSSATRKTRCGKSHAEDEARKIAAAIAKLPELLKSPKLLGQSSSSMALTDRVASRNSSAVAKRLGRLAIDLRNELVCVSACSSHSKIVLEHNPCAFIARSGAILIDSLGRFYFSSETIIPKSYIRP
jgi:hypothetical protein